MTNILRAIKNIIEHPVDRIKQLYEIKNRANSMGDALEEYIKDAFAGTLHESDESKRLNILREKFSYLGNQNNPPDIMIRGGNNSDAIEVKKIESDTSGIALNSSYPKAKLFVDSTMLTDECRKCESWTERDIIYCVGVVNDRSIKKLIFIYGIDYAASSSIYERIKNTISQGVNSIENIELAETNELGRVNRVDPLGITFLRIRGMWQIENPLKVFNYVYQFSREHQFEFMAIINESKYYSFPFKDRQDIESLSKETTNLQMTDIQIKVPDNPVELKKAKLITYFRGKNI